MFERSKKNFPSKKQLIEQFILMMAIILFIVGFTAVFGSENVLIGVVVATGILMFKDMDMGYQPRIGFWICWLIYILIPIVIYINGLNAYLGVVLNIAFVYLIMMLTQRDVYDANYLPFLLGYVFIYGSPVGLDRLSIRVLSAVVGGFLVAVVAYYFGRKRNKDHVVCLKNLTFTKDRIQVVFAAKMALGLGIAMFIGQIIGSEKAMWIAIAVLSLTQPHYGQTRQRITKRFWGNILGAMIFLLVFRILLPAQYAMIGVCFLNYINNFVQDYALKMSINTVNALVMAMEIFGSSQAINTRILFLLGGSVLAYVIGGIYHRRYGH